MSLQRLPFRYVGLLLITGFFISLLPSTPLLPVPLAPPTAYASNEPSLVVSFEATDTTTSVAWGDYDADGDLDLAVGNAPVFDPKCNCLAGGRDLLYQNSGGTFSVDPIWTSAASDDTQTLAWGDYNQDGLLDLVTAGKDAPLRIYQNISGTLPISPTWQSLESLDVRGLAWGDVDGDGALDLALAIQGANRIYQNSSTVNTPRFVPVWFSSETDPSLSVAWGDVDNDGDLDLTVGNGGILSHNQLYLNNGGTLETTASWTAVNTDTTRSLAWGDFDADGDLDLATGTRGQNRLYRNNGTALETLPSWSSDEAYDTTSVAWADMEGDGDLDLAVGNVPRYDTSCNCLVEGELQTYRTNNGDLSTKATWSSYEQDATYAVAWGDYDGDGDPDLAVGNAPRLDEGCNLLCFQGGEERIYRNEATTLPPVAAWSALAQANGNVLGLAWGDLNADNALDLAVASDDGTQGTLSVYHNLNNGRFETVPSTVRTFAAGATGVAWGDMNGDNRLDIAVSTKNGVLIYKGLGNDLSSAPSATLGVGLPGYEYPFVSPAWADYDGDGDLDLAVAQTAQGPTLFRNDGGIFRTVVWYAAFPNATGLAWGDVDGDGDLDLAASSGSNGVALYRNERGVLKTESGWTTSDRNMSMGLAWGDVDGDGDLDLAVANRGFNHLYLNTNGTLSATADWTSAQSDQTTGVAWGDIDGDGDLDLMVSNLGQPSRFYRNAGGQLETVAAWSVPFAAQDQGVALGDADNDGDLDVVFGGNSSGLRGTASLRGFFNGRIGPTLLPNNPPRLSILAPSATPKAFFFASPVIQSGAVITIPYRLADPEGDPVYRVQGFFSLDGGNNWQPAIPSAGTDRFNLAAPVTGTIHTFGWDLVANGFYGQLDTVVFRIAALVDHTSAPATVAGAFLVARTTDSSVPFRVRGTQVRVVDEQGHPLNDALVLRRPSGVTSAAAFIPAGMTSAPQRTNQLGYLPGWVTILAGDQLFALAPVTTTDVYSDSYQLYITNIVTSSLGATGFTVGATGLQTITVSPQHPLVLFNLDISLEWDARNDTSYMEQLFYDLNRGSEYLFNASNGQAAFGDINIFFDKENWDYAHIRVYASNRVRPNAIVGGVATQDLSETVTLTGGVTQTLYYGPGQVKMGATWNRFGEAGSSLSEDWPRTLVHELGHYLLFLDDNYVGQDTAGNLIPVESCAGLMSDPYAALYEFHPANGWLPDCEATLSHHTSGRPDWTTIHQYYPSLLAPSQTITDSALVGPSTVPMQTTTIYANDPLTPTERLDVPIFYTILPDSEGGGRYQAGSRAQAYLFQDSPNDADTLYDRITALGKPTLDRVLARGARVGDRLCIFEPPTLRPAIAPRVGCETISAGDEQIQLAARADWEPDLMITPLTSRTLAFEVGNFPAGADLRAELFPLDELPNPAPITLVNDARGVYTGTFVLDQPVTGAYVHVYVNESEPRREAVTGFSLGGNAGGVRNGGGGVRNGGGFLRQGAGGVRNGGGGVRNGGGGVRNGGGFLRQGGVPVSSAEGDVLIVGDNLTFDIGQFLLLQTASILPPPPTWVTIIGQGYRFTTSPSAPNLTDSALSFSYLGSDVPLGEEAGIRVYFRAPSDTAWRAIPTTLNTYHNIAAIPTQGAGLYALMSSIPIPLSGTGWNNFGYPVQETRVITDALASIAGDYNMVYNYVTTDTLDPWKLYSPDVPSWVNELSALEFGRGYWINITATHALTVEFRGATASLAGAANLYVAPATYYAIPAAQLGISAGAAVEAAVGGQVCGRSSTRTVGDHVGFVVDVFADSGPGQMAGCGALGRIVDIRIGGQLFARVPWENSQVHELPALLAWQVYVPVVVR